MSKKQMQPTSRKVTKKKKRRSSPFLIILCFLLSLATIGLFGLLAFQLVNLDMFPLTILVPILCVVGILTLLLFIFSNFKCRRPIAKVFMMVVLVVFVAAFGLGNNYVYSLTNLFNEVTNLTDKVQHTINVITPVESDINELSQLDGSVIGVVSTLDPEGTQRCLEDIKSEGVEVETVDYNSLDDLLYGLFNDQVDAIILNESYEGTIHENTEYVNFGVMINRVHETVYYTDRTKSQASSLDAVDNITTDPFTILISGNDSYGSLAENSRSDVNMLVTINPSSHTILMTSLPRDMYVPLACAEGAQNCPDGELDKLTHTGLYGVETTDNTIENFLDVDINYTVRVNFSSLVNIVDAVGGIDVYVDEGLAVDTFYANGTKGVDEGWNHLEGERALAFARERHAYQDGDNQRVKNQQIVLEALIDKIASASMLLHFNDFVEAVGGAFETNMPADQIRAFIRYQFAFMPEWKFENFTVLGNSSTEYCPSQGDYASVQIPYEEYIQAATQKIQKVVEGDSSEDVPSPSADTTTLTLRDYSGYENYQESLDEPAPSVSGTPSTDYYNPQYYSDPTYYDDSQAYADDSYSSSLY